MKSDGTALELVAALAKGEIGARELATVFLDRIAAREELNAFSIVDRNRVLVEAEEADRLWAGGGTLGPLHGLPIAIKDNVAVAGYRNAAGSPGLAGHVSAADAPVVARLRAAGAIVLGKTTMHELAWGTTSINPFSGTPKNPADPARSAGGSSGGAGSAVAARLAPIAIGTDTGGSVRIPASLCGVWGFRPTAGRWPNEAIVPISETRDTPGPLAQSAEDMALLHAVVTGEAVDPGNAGLSGRRIGIPRRHFWDVAEPEVAAICRGALDRLGAAGAELIEVEIGDLIHHYDLSSFDIALYETRRDLGRYLAAYAPEIAFGDVIAAIASPDVRETLQPLLDENFPVTEERYNAALTIHRARLRQAYQRLFDDHRLDALAFPTVPMPAFRLEETDVVLPEIGRIPVFAAMIHNTGPGSTAGIPGISMPVGQTAEGLPVGLALDGPVGGDKALLELAISAGQSMR